MWIKATTNETYHNTESGTVLGVGGGGSNWKVEMTYASQTARNLRDGFATQQDAQDALDALMVTAGYSEV